MTDFFSEILNEIAEGKITGKKQLQRRKSELSKKQGFSKIPTDSDLLAEAGENRESVLKVLQKKPSRTLSGVTTVAVMTKPSPCPQTPRCVYCPGGVEVGTPQSYTGHEPAAMRGIQFNFDAFDQTKSRIEQLTSIGHPTDKIELILMGGTLPAQSYDYQYDFVKGCFDAMNGRKSKDLKEAHKINETAEHRCVGMTFETRPDWCKQKEINSIIDFGGTRVELGVQNPDDEVYEIIKRGHTVEDVAESTKLCKDSFLKVNYHLMPGLPGSDSKKDLKMFRDVFSDERFKPDMLKIYPCLLVNPEYGKTELYDMFRRGEWKPYSDKEAAELIAKAKQFFPRWVRVMRIQRDIPTKLILEGVKSSNLRQLVSEEMKKQGIECNCIRCREIRDENPLSFKMTCEEYEASGGTEFFISFEETNMGKIIGFVRMRIPDRPFRKEITEKTAGVRELHVYGPSLEIGRKSDEESQHKGYGKRLLEEAERIAREEFSMKKMLVISGVGVRDYYRKQGYSLEGAFMSKQLK